MSVIFHSTKDHKNCQHFRQALKDIARLNLADSERTAFLSVSKNGLKIASQLPPAYEPFPLWCEYGLKKHVFTCLEDVQFPFGEQHCVFQIKTIKLLRAFNHFVENKVVLLSLNFQRESIRVSFETADQELACEFSIEMVEAQIAWPSPFTELDSHRREVVVRLATLDEQAFKLLRLSEKEIWLDISEKGLCFKKLIRGRFLSEYTLLKQMIQDYNWSQIKLRLNSRTFLSFKSQVFFTHLRQCRNAKIKCRMSLKLLMDPYDQTQLQQSWIVLENDFSWGYVVKVIPCAMGVSIEEVAKGKAVCEERASHKHRDSLLKREEPEGRRMIMNVTEAEIDRERENLARMIRETVPVGKFEEGEETFSRKIVYDFD